MAITKEHWAFCVEVLDAVRTVAERRDLRVERSPAAVAAVVSACARAALAVAKAGDADVKAVCSSIDDDGEIDVFVADKSGKPRDVIVR